MYRTTLGLALALPLALGACHKNAASGQAVATVNGEAITTSELKAELAQLPPAMREGAKAQVLQAMIDRRLLAADASAKKLDRSPTFVLQERRMAEVLRAQQTIQSFARGSQQPISQTEIETYLNRHPAVGADRQILVADQIRFPTPPKPVLDQFRPAKTLDQLIAILQANKVPFERGRGQFDTAQLPDETLGQINRLAPGEPLIAISGPTAVASSLAERRPAPLSPGDQAKLVRQRLAAERAETSVRQQTQALRGAATITYADGYKPAPTPTPTPTPR